jgi:hypothetical protein
MTCSQDFIIPNSAFSLLSSSCEYLHVCCAGRSEIVAVPFAPLNSPLLSLRLNSQCPSEVKTGHATRENGITYDLSIARPSTRRGTTRCRGTVPPAHNMTTANTFRVFVKYRGIIHFSLDNHGFFDMMDYGHS